MDEAWFSLIIIVIGIIIWLIWQSDNKRQTKSTVIDLKSNFQSYCGQNSQLTFRFDQTVFDYNIWPLPVMATSPHSDQTLLNFGNTTKSLDMINDVSGHFLKWTGLLY